MKRRSPVNSVASANDKNNPKEDAPEADVSPASVSPSEPPKLSASEVFQKPSKPPRGAQRNTPTHVRASSVIVSPRPALSLKRMSSTVASSQLLKFDPVEAEKRLKIFWKRRATFGIERAAIRTYLDEIVADRFILSNGMQILNDELQLAFIASTDVSACAADLSLPTVMTTLAYTNCGDRIQREATPTYERIVGSRFATKAEDGHPKVEMFSPAGGGTDDGFILAHVTVAHQMDPDIRQKLYNGNAKSYVNVNFDLMSHCGRHDTRNSTTYGLAKESPWRHERNACGAVIGCLVCYNPDNVVHKRIRSNLGEENWLFLSKNSILLEDGTNITYIVAAAIVALKGMQDTAQALKTELDERGVAHLTASLTINRMTYELDQLIYLGRATVFRGVARFQGFGLDARKFQGRMVAAGATRERTLTRNMTTTFDLVPASSGDSIEKHLVLSYDGMEDFEPYDLGAAPTHLSQTTDFLDDFV